MKPRGRPANLPRRMTSNRLLDRCDYRKFAAWAEIADSKATGRCWQVRMTPAAARGGLIPPARQDVGRAEISGFSPRRVQLQLDTVREFNKIRCSRTSV